MTFTTLYWMKFERENGRVYLTLVYNSNFHWNFNFDFLLNCQSQKFSQSWNLPHFRYKYYEITSIKSTINEFQTISKAFPNFLKIFSFDFLNYYSKHCKFNSSCTIGLNIVKFHLSPCLFFKGFPIIPKVKLKAMWSRRSQCDKQNMTKQTSYIPKWMDVMFELSCPTWHWFNSNDDDSLELI
jgi:hypothetical protein